jgi:outer membrane protein W
MRHTESNRRIGPIGGLFPSPWLALLIVALAAVAIAGSTCAAEDDTSWRVGLEFALVDPSGDFSTTSDNGNAVRASYDTGLGAGARGEYRFSDQYGVELSAIGAGSVELSSGTTGSYVRVSAVAPLMVGFNFHLTPDRPVDFYVGPMLGLVRYSDVEFYAGFGEVSTTVSVEDDFAWGAIAGLEIPIGSRGWQVQGSLRYIETDIRDSGGPISIDTEFDPLIVSIGVGYRF